MSFTIAGILIKKIRSVVNGIATIACHGNNLINALIIFGSGCHIVNKLGSTHDSSVFRDSFLYDLLNSGILRENAFILGYSGYPLLPKLMIPYRIFELTGEDLEKKDHYNFCQSSARLAAERGNGYLKRRMRPLHVGLKTSNSTYVIHLITGSNVQHEW